MEISEWKFHSSLDFKGRRKKVRSVAIWLWFMDSTTEKTCFFSIWGHNAVEYRVGPSSSTSFLVWRLQRMVHGLCQTTEEVLTNQNWIIRQRKKWIIKTTSLLCRSHKSSVADSGAGYHWLRYTESHWPNHCHWSPVHRWGGCQCFAGFQSKGKNKNPNHF